MSQSTFDAVLQFTMVFSVFANVIGAGFIAREIGNLIDMKRENARRWR